MEQKSNSRIEVTIRRGKGRIIITFTAGMLSRKEKREEKKYIDMKQPMMPSVACVGV